MSNTDSTTINEYRPRLLITSGEPAGIGPDLIIGLGQGKQDYDFTVLADPDLIESRARLLGTPIARTASTDQTNIQYTIGNGKPFNLIPIYLKKAVTPGKPDSGNAHYVLEQLEWGADACLKNNFDAVITAPVQKSVINDAGIPFSGHTEYFAKRCGDCLPVMLLSCPGLRVALMTTHLPLKDVAAAITKDKVENVLRIVIHAMSSHFGFEKPRLKVCGLNPHAGESGHLGKEEQTIISPVLEKLRREGHDIGGPLPADTAFRPEFRNNTEVYVCMYHDQGLPILKTLGFGEAVNITLGLPIIRTSVDHGTALELAATGKAQHESLLAAMEAANRMAINRFNRSEIPADKKAGSLNEC